MIRNFITQKATRSAFFQILGYSLQAVNFFVNISIANALGANDYAMFASVMVWYALITTFTTFGMYEFLISLFTDDERVNHEILLSGIFLHTAILLTGYIIIVLIYGFTKSEVNYLFILMPFIFVSGFSIIQTYSIYLLNGHVVAKIQLMTMIIANSAKILAIMYYPNIIAFVLIYGIEISLTAVFAILFSRIKHRLLAVTKKSLQYYWPTGFIYFLISVLSLVGSRLDQILIAMSPENIRTASYFASLRIVELSFFLPVILNQSYLSVSDKKLIKNYNTMYIFLLIIVCIGFYLFSEIVFETLYSEEFSSSHIIYFLPYLITFWISQFVKFNALKNKNYWSILAATASGFCATWVLAYSINLKSSYLAFLPAIYHAAFILTLFYTNRWRDKHG